MICTFFVSKLVTVIPLAYIPLYFLETLQMNKVCIPPLLLYSCSHMQSIIIINMFYPILINMQTSIATGPLVLFIVSGVLTPFVKIIYKYVGIKVSKSLHTLL